MLNRYFSKYEQKIIRTESGIKKYLVGPNQSRISLWNDIQLSGDNLATVNNIVEIPKFTFAKH